MKKKTILILVFCLVVLAGSSAGAYYFFNNYAGKEAGGKTNTKAVKLESMDMGETVVNLAGNGGGRYLRVKIVIEHPVDKKLAEELKKKKHQVSDVIIKTLRSKTMPEVNSAGSLEGVKNSLLKEINSQLEHGGVAGIYFTEYLVQ